MERVREADAAYLKEEADMSAHAAAAYANGYADGVAVSLNGLAEEIHHDNAHWWTNPKTGKRLSRNKGEMIALMHSELSEAMEAERKSLMDDHLPHRRGVEVELADLIIRVLDYCGGHRLDISGAVAEKRAYNKTRQDHTNEARLAAGGKKW
jgi:hypothetical protein